jgi:hypothetical protein
MKSPRTTTTLGDLRRATPWLWLYRERRRHSAPIACALPVIRWGPDRSSDKLRQFARCTACGHRGCYASTSRLGPREYRLHAISYAPARAVERRQKAKSSTLYDGGRLYDK